MRLLLAFAGLFVLAGAAVAGRPTAHTLRKSAGGPIAAVAANNKVAAWLTSSNKTPKTCDQVHVLAPGKHDRSLPQPSPQSTTCNWDLSNGQSQLAVATHMSTALWTLHEGGPAPFDWVLAATFGGPERQLKKLAHASDGTGKWLVGLAGAGRTLAYSWDDVEYVNPSACLSGGSCKEKIAGGGIDIVTKTTDTPLLGAGPALQLAASAGRIAYVPATTVRDNRPAAASKSALDIVDATDGSVVGLASVHGIPIALALAPHVLAVLTTLAGPHDRISWFATNGTKLGSLLVSAGTTPELATSDRLIVYRVGRLLRGISTRTGHNSVLAKTGPSPVGLSLAHGRLIWAENHAGAGRLRSLSVG